MNIKEEILNVIQKYDLKPIDTMEFKNVYEFLKNYPEEYVKYKSIKDDIYFIRKYEKYIVNGYYGFSLGSPLPVKWNEIIDEVLQLFISNDPSFKIRQIKFKFGAILFYCDSKIEEFEDLSSLLSKNLYDPKLIY